MVLTETAVRKRITGRKGGESLQTAPPRQVGRLTKVKTLNSMRMEKPRKTAYIMRHAKPKRRSRVQLLRCTPTICRRTDGQRERDEKTSQMLVRFKHFFL